MKMFRIIFLFLPLALLAAMTHAADQGMIPFCTQIPRQIAMHIKQPTSSHLQKLMAKPCNQKFLKAIMPHSTSVLPFYPDKEYQAIIQRARTSTGQGILEFALKNKHSPSCLTMEPR